jgi:hypothetical protein
MYKLRLIIIVSLTAGILLLNKDCLAGIGYTREQCEEKYGKEVAASSDVAFTDIFDFLDKEAERHCYENARYKVMVTLDAKGRAIEAFYIWPLGKNPTGEEIKAILELSSNKWKMGTNEGGRKATITDEGLELTVRGGGQRSRFDLEITTPAYRRKEKKELFK